MSSAIWARRPIAALVSVLLLMATALAQQATPSQAPQARGQQAGQQPDQHSMASAMISADMIGGQAVVIKNKYGLGRDEMLFPNVPRSIKFASGENPKRVFGTRNQLPSTRMGNFEVMRQALQEGREYMREWEDYNNNVKSG